MRTVVMRLGQVCGDRLGHWNEKEWFPALVKSAQLLRCLPDVGGVRDVSRSYASGRVCSDERG